MGAPFLIYHDSTNIRKQKYLYNRKKTQTFVWELYAIEMQSEKIPRLF